MLMVLPKSRIEKLLEIAFENLTWEICLVQET